MLNAHDILETITMIQEENLDIRTITMGISLLDCCDSDLDRTCQRVYDKITRQAKDLVKTGEQIEKEYGIPIINKRISVTPIAMIAAACDRKEPVRLAQTPVSYTHLKSASALPKFPDEASSHKKRPRALTWPAGGFIFPQTSRS